MSAFESRLPATCRSRASSPWMTQRFRFRQGDIAAGVGGARVLNRVGGHRGQVDGQMLEGPAFVEPRQEQQLIDEQAHALRLLLDAAHGGREVLRPVLGAAAEELGVAADRGERRAQLVRGIGQEAPQPVPDAVRSAKAASIFSSMTLSDRPSRPTSVCSSAGSTRRDRSPAAMAAAVRLMSSSGRRPRRMMSQARLPRTTRIEIVMMASPARRRPSVCRVSVRGTATTRWLPSDRGSTSTR